MMPPESPTPSPDSERDERAAFEAWAKKNGYELDIDSDSYGWGYMFESTGDAWEGWCGRASLSEYAQSPTAVHVDSSQRSGDGGHSAWLPIDSAPKDERVLLFVPAFGPWVASWWPGSWAWTRDQWTIHTPFSASGDRAVFGTDIPGPSHWMPLPAAPGAGLAQSKQEPEALSAAQLWQQWSVAGKVMYYQGFVNAVAAAVSQSKQATPPEAGEQQ